METEPNSLTEGQPAPNNENSSPDSVQPSADIGASLDKTQAILRLPHKLKIKKKGPKPNCRLRSRLGVVMTTRK